MILLPWLLALIVALPVAAASTGREIMEKVDARDDGDNATQTLHMILIDKNRKERVRELRKVCTGLAQPATQ